MANPVTTAVNADTHNFANVGDFYDFEVSATDPDTTGGAPGETVTHTVRLYVEDAAGNRTPVNFFAEITSADTPGTAETLTWLEPQTGDVPAGFSVVRTAHTPGNPATATYRITRDA